MPYKPPRTLIEKLAVKFGLIPDVDGADVSHTVRNPGKLSRYPAERDWDNVVEYDPKEWPRRAVGRNYRLVPTTCFNCESACGLLAYVDKQSNTIRKLEGNPVHPGSRGKNCAKGPATINQVNDPDRILAPQKRVGPRGSGQWQEVSWDEALGDIGGRIRRALQENRRDEIVYHVGRPGAEGYMDRVLRAWGVDGHNSHTNICSSGARFGYAIWSGYDRPSPDYANARFILALNAHLESGHYFNPHAQRISEGMKRGARMAVVDPRLSNTASMATYWLPTRPGTEAALLLAFARIILEEGLYDRGFIERWTNWRAYLKSQVSDLKSQISNLVSQISNLNSETPNPENPQSFDDFLLALRRLYSRYTPEFAEAECGVSRDQIVTIARHIGEAGSKFCSHTWRGASSAHEGGWQVARCLYFLHVLTGSVGTEGGCLPSAWNKYKADLIDPPPPQAHWNELHSPREFPLAHYEMSFLLPHFLKAGRGRIDTYFTRVFNPVWTYPDGFTWIEALRDESKIGCHVALTPTWNETALYADYVLPMGHGPERHDLNTYETHSATWIAFRQPVLRAAAEADGRTVRDTRDTNPGNVWEEDEFWFALSWAIDPDGSLGIRRYFESKKKPGEMLRVDEYYEHIFERVPGLPAKAQTAGLTPLAYMRKYGAFEVKQKTYLKHERHLSDIELEGSKVDPETGVVTRNGAPVGVCLEIAHREAVGWAGLSDLPSLERHPPEQVGQIEDPPWRKADPPYGAVVEGFPTPSRLLEFFSPTMVEWGWPEHAIPEYIPSHVYLDEWEEAGRVGIAHQSHDAISPAKVGDAHPTTHPSPDHAITKSPNHFVLLPTFRLPTLIHTRSGSAKWLNEISQRNPVWIHTADAASIGVATGDLVRVSTDIGHFIDRCWVTEGVRPGVVACSHHLGRWRRKSDPPLGRWSANVVAIEDQGDGAWRMRTVQGPVPFESSDPDSSRLWWREGGVPQNLTFPVHPDPISGMHCWHQRVTVIRAAPGDQCGDVFVDTKKSMEIFENWMKKTRWPAGPGNLRRPLWLNRPLRPTDAVFHM
ncbi:MAG TPA: molybdopterin-dependent oxidoreductase [Phycisphaerae bacterium]|nr:molybdopterin-dependent oxidoreductase [Phycisphaerae bacterium]